MKNPTSLVTALRDSTGAITAIVDEDGKNIAVGNGNGGGTAVTATAPLVKTGNALSLPAATTSASGAMTGAMVTALNSVVTDVATKANAPAAPAAITANRNLSAADDGRTLYNNTANAYTLTIPSGLPAGFGVAVVQKSTGAVTVATASGVTLTSSDGFTKTGGANKVISVMNSGVSNDYILSGQGAA